MNILFITPDIPLATGGGLVGSTIEESLYNAAFDLKYSVFTYTMPKYRSSFHKLWNQLIGYTSGMSYSTLQDIKQYIIDKSIDVIVYNNSKYGRAINFIKILFPHIRHVVFFHNAEYKFVYGAIKKTRNPFGFITLYSTWLNERKSVQAANLLVALNNRDANDIEQMYGRTVDYICPISLRDRFDRNKIKTTDKIIGAFIGSNFYANNHGVKWFAENVSPHINYPILIIGKDFEKENEFFSKYKNLQLIGTVDDVDQYYYNISFIVSPIFCGSGMKTKTAEAMMFGKTIFGTSEAFEGYEIEFNQIGCLCNSADEFINAINSFNPNKYYNEYSRSNFISKYSQSNIVCLFERILKIV